MQHQDGQEHSPTSNVPSMAASDGDDFTPEQLRRRSTEMSMHERLFPKAEHHGMVLYDDHCHLDYEWIRMPKKRDFDIFRVAVQDTKDRDDADVPLHTTASDGRKIVMWAKMDTGANTNVINPGTLRKLLGDSYENMIQPIADPVEIKVYAGYIVTPTHQVQLSFCAGRTLKEFRDVQFIVNPQEGDGADTDGVPNVLLGYEFLRENSMMMIDVEYHHNEVDPDAEVISHRAEDEQPNVTRIFNLGLGAKPQGLMKNVAFHPPAPGRPKPQGIRAK